MRNSGDDPRYLELFSLSPADMAIDKMEFGVSEHQPKQVLGNMLQTMFWWVKRILGTYCWRYCIIAPKERVGKERDETCFRNKTRQKLER